MRKAVWCLTIFLALALATPQWTGVFLINGDSANLSVDVIGQSPLEITIPPGASITNANYENGIATFNNSFSYSLISTDMLTSISDGKIFFFIFEQPQEFDYKISVILPEGESIESTIPQGTYASDGKHIGARWEGTSSLEQFSLRYYSLHGLVVKFIETDIPIVDKTIFLPGIILAFLLGYFLAAGLVTIMLQRFKQITAQMNEEEKSIVHLLRNGPQTQSQIQKKLDFSKAKLSRTLREMEERKIIEKTPKGKTNLISLK